MNGSANPLLDKEEHILKLGESFEKRPKSSFHTIRCKSENKFSFWDCGRIEFHLFFLSTSLKKTQQS